MKKNTLQKIAAVAGAGTLFLALVSPALALDVSTGANANLDVGATTGGSTTGAGLDVSGGHTGYDVGATKKPIVGADARAAAKVSAAQAKLNAKAALEIKKRVDNLNALSARLGDMKHLTDAQKASLSASINGSIGNLTALQAKISGDATAADLKTDTASITKDERVFALVDPVVKISAAADRATTIAGMLADVNTKLQTRITAAQVAGTDMSATADIQADMVLKTNDAKTQAAAAITVSTGLTPDGGDAAKLASNNAALKEARADLQAANQDLKTAQSDLDKVVKALKALSVTAKVDAKTKQGTSGSAKTGN